MTSIVIFGATSAIAQNVARLYAQSGAKLLLVARDGQKLSAVAADLRARGAASVEERLFDFCGIDDIAALAEGISASFGIPDRALIAYGTLPDQAKAGDSESAARQALDLNFLSPALLLQAMARLMARSGGAIGVIGSVAGDRGRASNYVYGAAKGGLGIFAQGLAHSLARGAAPKPLAIILVKPGFVDTPMTASFPKGALWAKPEAVASDIFGAMERGRSAIIYTPWFWRFVMLIIRLVPQPLMHKTGL